MAIASVSPMRLLGRRATPMDATRAVCRGHDGSGFGD